MNTKGKADRNLLEVYLILKETFSPFSSSYGFVKHVSLLLEDSNKNKTQKIPNHLNNFPDKDVTI